MLTLFFTICIALLGSIAHWYKKWYKKQLQDSFWTYIKVHPQATMYSVFTTIGAVTTLSVNGPMDITDPAVIANLFTIGFTADSIMNKGSSDA